MDFSGEGYHTEKEHSASCQSALTDNHIVNHFAAKIK